MNHYDLPLEVIERHATPRGEIQLQRRGTFFEIISNGTFLMATYNGESERLLLREPLKRTSHPTSVLIGGLGVGYSLQEALSDPRVEKVTVIEIEDTIIEWNHTILSTVSGGAVKHPKARIVHADCLEWLRQNDEHFDLICLDIDNGPDWHVYVQNETLYSNYGLALLARHLQPDGCLSFWSATSSPEFVTSLKQHFKVVDVLYVPQERGEPDAIFLTQHPIVQAV
ncbi:spermine/spermidine synthase [Paenibacillus glacialis]|uniref:Spermine/spermidine synthase n=1 Tax=Paenibacillus glacialis TaxID=494026 RepID=A0A168KRR5_9BACL|nr:spermine/spermidine synthase [Paenibacillus glacialis]OAB42379.1 spermine/spermidine synthase [Paenibacillus glacialis]